MSGVFSVLSDAQAGMFRMQKAKKPWEKELEATDAKGQLGQKAERAADALQLTPRGMRDHAGAKAALEEAQRVGGPKAAAEQRLERVERKIQELKLAMRHAQGDPQKMAQLAAEAARLAKEAGRAAKEYGAGIANAAAMGLPGGAGAVGTTETTRTTTVTSLTVRQTEFSLSLTVTAGADGAAVPVSGVPPAAGAAAGAAPGAAEALAAGLAEGEATEAMPPAGGNGLSPELAGMVDGVLAGLSDSGSVSGGGTRGERARALIQNMIADNDLKMSRYREADGFGRRVEAVLHVAKQVIGEAKIANELDESEKRRKERREGFKEIDKVIDGAQKEVNALRQAAFGSKVEGADDAAASDESAGEDGEASAGGLDAGALPAGGDVAGGGMPAIDMLA